MRQGNSLCRSVALATALVLANATAAAQTADEIVDGLHMSEAQRRQLESGDIVTFSGEPYENTRRELAADATVLVQQSLDQVLAQIESVPSIIPAKLLIDYADIDSAADFDEVEFTPDEYDEANRLLNAKVGKHFNLSREETQKLRDINKRLGRAGRQEQVDAASQAMREILKARYEAYLQDGLAGIPPYQRSSRKAISIGDELRLTTETFEPVERHFNDYYRTLAGFPESSDCCVHTFRWLKARIKKRPTFALAHTIVQKTDDHLLVTERHYYVSNTLNSVQVTLAWIAWEQDTFLGLAMSASTDILDSLLGRALRPLGRNKASDLVKDVLTEIRDDLEQSPPPDG